MVIVRIQGGLANQMYQYTFYYWLVQKHKEKKLLIDSYCDLSLYKHIIPKQECDPVHNGYELERVFGLYVPEAPLKEVYRLSEFRYNFISKVVMKLRNMIVGNKSTQINDSEKGIYDESLAECDDVFFNGTWGGFRYANEYENDIRKIFKFPELNDEYNRKMAEMIVMTNSVSIHVRRGDYLRIGNGIALNKEYYDNAVAIIKTKVEKPIFFVFSDDIKWCKENLDYANMYFIEHNNGEDSYKDMQLMSMCKYNIVANSTFSAWASWLNDYEDKIIIYPREGNSCLVQENGK